MVTKLFISCSKGKKSWFFDENSTVSDIIETAIKSFEFEPSGFYELWQSYKEEQINLNPDKKIKDLKLKSEEILHFIDLTFTIKDKNI